MVLETKSKLDKMKDQGIQDGSRIEIIIFKGAECLEKGKDVRGFEVEAFGDEYMLNGQSWNVPAFLPSEAMKRWSCPDKRYIGYAKFEKGGIYLSQGMSGDSFVADAALYFHQGVIHSFMKL